MESWISAGDVGRYVYCPLNWKLSREGAEGTKSARGIKRHEELAQEVDALELYQSRARWSIQSSFLLALFAISAGSLAIELFYLSAGTPLRAGLIVLSIAWLMGSLYLFFFDIYFRGRGQQLVRRAKLVPGEVTFADVAHRTNPLLESKIVPLRGRPDYVVQQDGKPIPVEAKSGKTPRRPYDSHVMQLAAYCYLVAETYGVRPPFGILSYPEQNFEVAYTPQLEDDLLRNLLRIQLALRIDDVHRNHQNPKRCLGCSRREGCPERLA